MAERAGAGIGWLQRWWRRSTQQSEQQPGTAMVVEVAQAVASLEARLCEGMVRRSGTAASAALAARTQLPGPAQNNLFGRPVWEESASGPAQAVAAATGMALSGLRATALLGGSELDAARDALRDSASRLTPLVVHASLGEAGHSGYTELADSVGFQILASSGQAALDWSLVARWLSERALTTGLVAVDGDGVESLRLPNDESVRAYLGRPHDLIEAPSDAQRALFGRERPRLLPWFDLDRPVATGGERGSTEAFRARVAQEIFFRDATPELAQQAMDEWSRISGRPLSFVQEHALEGAEIVLVGQGATVPAAQAVADHLRRERGLKIGVLEITWLRPFPEREVARALAGRRAVAVIEALADPPSREGPLLRALAATVPGSESWVSAIAAPSGPEPAELVALCERLGQPDPPRQLRLLRAEGGAATGFPRRDALLQSVSNAYPQLSRSELPEAEAPAPPPDEGRSLGLLGLEADLPPDAVVRLASALSSETGPVLRGTQTRPAPGVREARLRAAGAAFPDPGSRARVERLWVATDRFCELTPSLQAVQPGGRVLISTEQSLEQLWASLPAAWRREIRAGGLRLQTIPPGFEQGIELLQSCWHGEEADLLGDGRLQEVIWRDLEDPEQTEPEIPGVMARISRSRPAHDSLPRFWGEIAQPRQAGIADALREPLSATGVVPAGASALEPAASASLLPVLDPSACSGCGKCWSVCPDSAIGATALGIETLLTAASRFAGTQGRAADAVRRSHRQLATRFGRELLKQPGAGLDADRCQSGWDWLVGRLAPPGDERPDYDAAFAATQSVIETVQPMATPPLFADAERQSAGSGALLVLAVDPRACLGCGLCLASCPEDALQLEQRTPEQSLAFEERWRAWEALPDSDGATLEKAAAHPELGDLAAALLSRHCAQAQVGGAGEPGSGEKLACRWVASLVERHAQRAQARSLQTLAELRQQIEEKLREQLTAGLSEADIDTLHQAVSGIGSGRADLSELGAQLDGLGSRATFDRASVLRLTRRAAEIDATRQRLGEGLDGMGRARFGVVVARGHIGEWAARFPHQPYFAPLTLAPTEHGVELARGIARGLASEHLSLVRGLRMAALDVEAPPDHSVRAEAIRSLGWQDLSTEERSASPPLLLLADDDALLGSGFAALARLLEAELPIKLVLLDGRGQLDAASDPSLVAMAHRGAFVLAASLAHPEAMARGMTDALRWPGPALIHVHAPSPRRHGFAPEEMLERARLAVEGRAHVLLRYDPSAEGHFGLRASLEGNPEPDADWGATDYACWAAGEARFADHFEEWEGEGGVPLAQWLQKSESDRRGQRPVIEMGEQRLAVSDRIARTALERLSLWHTLRELTGGRSPFTDRIRASLAADLEVDRKAEMAALETESEARVAALRAESEGAALERLTGRLLTLSGFGGNAASKRDRA